MCYQIDVLVFITWSVFVGRFPRRASSTSSLETHRETGTGQILAGLALTSDGPHKVKPSAERVAIAATTFTVDAVMKGRSIEVSYFQR